MLDCKSVDWSLKCKTLLRKRGEQKLDEGVVCPLNRGIPKDTASKDKNTSQENIEQALIALPSKDTFKARILRGALPNITE